MFSIIIINYRTPRLTSNCLDSLFQFCPVGQFEIIVVDNNSGDDSLLVLTTKFGDRIKLISNATNSGFAAANNLGARAATGEYLFFLNSDTSVKQDILTPLRRVLEQDPEIGIIAPQLVLVNGQPQSYTYGYTRKSSEELAWVSGAALVIRLAIFQLIGGWDEKYFMYFEDIDLSRAVLKQGYKISRLDSVAVTHLVAASPLAFWRRKLYYYQAKIRFIFKTYA